MFADPRALLLALLAALGTFACSLGAAAEIAEADAWEALPRYEYGQDMAALLVIDRAVIRAMASPAEQAACAAKLAAVLAASDTTPAARQYACLHLRQIGTPAEVPLLRRMLEGPDTADVARQALENIPGDVAGDALRHALETLEGNLRLGAIHSVAARGDEAAVASLQRLAGSPDERVAGAAWNALAEIAGPQACEFLRALGERAGIPTPAALVAPLVRCGESWTVSGDADKAGDLWRMLSHPDQPLGARRAALEGLLRLEGARAATTVVAWMSDPDAVRRQIAAGHLRELSEEQLDTLLEGFDVVAEDGMWAAVELAVERRGKALLPAAMAWARSELPAQRRMGAGLLGRIGEPSAIPLLVDLLGGGDKSAAAAQDALADLPREPVNTALLAALRDRPEIRLPVIASLVRLRSYEAIDPLIAIASQADPELYGPALDGLRSIADPDKTDVPRLLKLLLAVEPGSHRDEVEKTILVVSQKLPAGADRAGPVLDALASIDRSALPNYLPLLGRLGGPRAGAILRPCLTDSDEEVRDAAVRALCNWPDAQFADQLWELAQHAEQPAHRRRSLRAYIRVVSLPGDRPAAETLAMLQGAMQLAENADDKRLIVERASTVRTIEAVAWIASYLDDPEADQAACAAIVELAHQRPLRHPNMDQFAPILERVARISRDPAVVERARRYRLGL